MQTAEAGYPESFKEESRPRLSGGIVFCSGSGGDTR